jgi:hypothetical protein
MRPPISAAVALRAEDEPRFVLDRARQSAML